MKKILFVAVFAGFASVAAAQTTRAAAFGLKGGLNASNVKIDLEDEDEASERRIGYHFGAFANVPLGGMFSLNPELLYSAEGGKEEEDDEKEVIKLNYLNVPIMFQYNNPSGFFLETGPQLGFLLSAKNKYEFEDEEEEEDIKDDFEGVNLSWGLGAGYKMTSGIGFGVRYNYGLSNIIKESSDDFKFKTSSIQVSLIYTLGR